MGRGGGRRRRDRGLCQPGVAPACGGEQIAADDFARQAQQIRQLARESQVETRKLASAVDTLNGDRDRLYSRVTVLEQGLDSVTGAIAKQAAAAAKPVVALGRRRPLNKIRPRSPPPWSARSRPRPPRARLPPRRRKARGSPKPEPQVTVTSTVPAPAPPRRLATAGGACGDQIDDGTARPGGAQIDRSAETSRRGRCACSAAGRRAQAGNARRHPG